MMGLRLYGLPISIIVRNRETEPILDETPSVAARQHTSWLANRDHDNDDSRPLGVIAIYMHGI
jgi:hypothetical protein